MNGTLRRVHGAIRPATSKHGVKDSAGRVLAEDIHHECKTGIIGFHEGADRREPVGAVVSIDRIFDHGCLLPEIVIGTQIVAQHFR